MEDVLKGYDKENADKYVEFLESADIRNPRTIKRCVNFCLLHHYMDGEDAVSVKDKNVKLHRFAIKMLELEREKLYLELLTKIRALEGKYADLKAWFFVEEKLKCDLFYKVLECFGINETTNEKNIEIFADYIIRSAPADMEVLKYLEYAQNLNNLISNIINNRTINHFGFHSSLLKTGENINISRMSVPEIAKTIEEKGIKCQFIFNLREIIIQFDLKNQEQLVVLISGMTFEKEFIDSYCEDYIDAAYRLGYELNKDKLFYMEHGNKYKIFNIKDISSPDAPIYQILQAAGVIKIPTELTPAAP